MLYSYIYIYLLFTNYIRMCNSFSTSKNIVIPKNGDPYITSKIYFKQTKNNGIKHTKNNGIKYTKIPYITSNFIRSSL